MNINNNFKEYIYKKLLSDKKTYKILCSLDNIYEYNENDFAIDLTLFAKTLTTKYYNKELAKKFRENIKSNNYENAFNILINEYLYVAIEIEISYNDLPDKLNRKVLVPIRYNMANLVYLTLSLFGCIENNKFAEILDEKGNEYILMNEINDRYNYEDNFNIANDFFIANFIQDNKKSTIIFDYKKDIEFNLEFKEIKLFSKKDEYKYFANILSATGVSMNQKDKFNLSKDKIAALIENIYLDIYEIATNYEKIDFDD